MKSTVTEVAICSGMDPVRIIRDHGALAGTSARPAWVDVNRGEEKVEVEGGGCGTHLPNLSQPLLHKGQPQGIQMPS